MVVRATLNYDEPEVESVARGRSPLTTVHHLYNVITVTPLDRKQEEQPARKRSATFVPRCSILRDVGTTWSNFGKGQLDTT